MRTGLPENPSRIFTWSVSGNYQAELRSRNSFPRNLKYVPCRKRRPEVKIFIFIGAVIFWNRESCLIFEVTIFSLRVWSIPFTRYHLARQGREALLYIREWTVELRSSPTPHHVSSNLSSSRPPSGGRIGAKSMIFFEFGFQKITPKRAQTLLKSGSLNVHIPVANACFWRLFSVFVRTLQNNNSNYQ